MTPEELDALEKRILLSGPVRAPQIALESFAAMAREIRQSWALRDAGVEEVKRLREELRRARNEIRWHERREKQLAPESGGGGAPGR